MRISPAGPASTSVPALWPRPAATHAQARRWPRACWLLLPIVLAGCREAEEVTQYTVPRPQRAAQQKTDQAPSAEARPGRILGAILPRGGQTWFFKLMGPSEQVASVAESFVEFMGSTHFEQGGPRWQLPEGWREQPGDGQFRFATILVPGEPDALELTVSPLPSAEDEFEAYLLSNVNRWRDQLGTEPLPASKLSGATVKQALGSGDVWFVNLTGTLPADWAPGRSAAPMSPRRARPASGSQGAQIDGQ